MKTNMHTMKSSAQEGRERRDRKIVAAFFSMLGEMGMTLAEFNRPGKGRHGVAMPTYEAIACELGISSFTVLRVLQRQGYVPRRRYVLVEETPACAPGPEGAGAECGGRPSNPEP